MHYPHRVDNPGLSQARVVSIPSDYPRPQFYRDDWFSLDGTWGFALDATGGWSRPPEVVWDRSITVPFSPETPASGIADPTLYSACWYRREVDIPELAA